MGRTSTRVFAALFSAAMVVAAAGCGSSSKTSTAPNTPEQLKADKAIAQQAVLTLSDMPPGFKATPHQASSDDTPEPVLRRFAQCAKVPQAEIADFIKRNDPKQPDVDSADFSRLDVAKGALTTFENNVAIDRSSKHIGSQFDVLAAKSTLKCWKDFFRAAMVSSSDTGVSARGVTVVSLPIDKIADQSAAFGVRATVVRPDRSTVKLYFDFYIARSGRAAISLLATGVGEQVDSSLAQSLMQTVADRLEKTT